MADVKKRRPENHEGAFYVDTTCIDCGTCYWVSAEVFRRHGSMSAVHRQPDKKNLEASYRALYSCPTN